MAPAVQPHRPLTRALSPPRQPSIRCGFLFVYVNLILAYLGASALPSAARACADGFLARLSRAAGQASKMITDGEGVISNLFYQTIPGPANGALFWVVWCAPRLLPLGAQAT